jgi:hypothetical protein
MTELKRCPHCGSKAEYVHSMAYDWVRCGNMNCHNTATISVRYWNTRPIEDELQARITELETELLNTMIIKYANEDEIPNMDDSVYDRMNSCSLVHGVKLFPYIEKHGKKYYLVDLENEQ